MTEEITAKALEKDFKEHSVAEFFKKNRQMLGLTGKVRTLTTVVHEYVTNSLDATESAGIPPKVSIRIKELGNEYYEVTSKDNGPGLTMQTVGKALGMLLAGTKFHRMVQARGQQGIGAAGITMLTQITTGKPVKVVTGTGDGKANSMDLMIDPKTNSPKITNNKEIESNSRGLEVKAQIKGVLYKEGPGSPLEYLKRSAIANPHAEITLIDPKGKKIIFKKTSQTIPILPKEMKPHPYGVTVDDLLTLSKYTQARKINSFLKSDFDRVGNNAVEEMQKKVKFDLNKDPKLLTWEEAEAIVKAFKSIQIIAPSTAGLIPIGHDRIKKSMLSILKPEFVSVITRKPRVYAGGFPFQLEVGLAYGGDAGKALTSGETKLDLMRFANRAPLLFDGSSCAITKAVNAVEWKRYGIKDIESTPLAIFINLISVHIPYTGAGKQAISDEEEILEELKLALMDCARRTATYIRTKKTEEDNRLKQEMFYKYIPEIASALNKITKSPEKTLIDKLENLVETKLGIKKLKEKKEGMAVTKEEQEEDAFDIEEEGGEETNEE